MLTYWYDNNTKEFKEAQEAFIDPIDGGYLLPADSTFVTPPIVPDGSVAVFDESNERWDIKTDHRKGWQVKLDDITFSVVNYIGDAHEGYQFITDEEYNKYENDNDSFEVIDGVFIDVTDTPEYALKKLKEAKEIKYNEANDEAVEFLESGIADFELSENIHIEATKENMNTLATAAIAIEKGLVEYQTWTSKEDNVINLDQEQCLTISMGIGVIQSDVWNRQFILYKNEIESATTVEEVEAININYEVP